MGWDSTSESVCDIAKGLAVVGDRWTLLIMREISMGVRRFDDIQVQTGMSSNLLTMRLKRLVEDGVIERRQYSAHANRFEYHATQKGRELDGVLLAIRAWALRWCDTPPTEPAVGAEPAVNLIYKKTGETVDALWQAPRNKKPFSFSDTSSTISEKFSQEREGKVAMFKESRLKSDDKPARKPRAATSALPVPPARPTSKAKNAARPLVKSPTTPVKKTAAPATRTARAPAAKKAPPARRASKTM
jgi:DNA-binding HxlR family transcriptional regulator